MDNLTYRGTNIVLLFYTTFISVDLAHHEIVRAKVVKDGINSVVLTNWFAPFLILFRKRPLLFLYARRSQIIEQ